jgi:archaellum component FlaF (FlaF/FlaG flagellin family)
MSADGRFVAFNSRASNLVPGDTNQTYDVFVRDLQAGTIGRVSLRSDGAQSNGTNGFSAISAEGRYVAFESYATNLVPGDNNGVADILVHDRVTGTTERVSVGANGAQANGWSSTPSISADGRHVSFTSFASNLVPGDTNQWEDIFVRDRLNGTTERVSVDSNGAQADNFSSLARISADGRYVPFTSRASNLVPGDSVFYHVYLRDRAYAVFEGLCDPGVAGVLGCPCANPPSGPGRGCDNSSATGGADLSASGIAYFSRDSLVFTTSGEKPSSLSIVLQGDSDVSVGLFYGQGVRCVAGSLKRLFVKSASGGSITAPDFGAGDPSVSARSAAKGDVIQPGESRLYLVYYRDPVVLGGCPATSTFNATQSGRVPWSF